MTETTVLLTSQDMAAHLRVSESTFKRFRAKHAEMLAPAVTYGGRNLWMVSQLEAFLGLRSGNYTQGEAESLVATERKLVHARVAKAASRAQGEAVSLAKKASILAAKALSMVERAEEARR